MKESTDLRNWKLLFFYFPLVLNTLNLQNIVSTFLSVTLAQLIAYGTFGLLVAGTIMLFGKEKGRLTPLIRFWFLFYIVYYCFAFLASGLYGNMAPFLKSIIPPVYFIAFAMLLRREQERVFITKIFTVVFFIASIILIVFKLNNFGLDYQGRYEYTINRAGGVYGDANNAAAVCLLSLIFLKFTYKPLTKSGKIFKVIALLISLYALILTFSVTGFLILILISIITFRKYFTGLRLVVGIFLFPTLLVGIYTWSQNTSSLTQVQKSRFENVANLLTFQTEEVNYSDRDVLFDNMMDHIVENPLLGNGVMFSVQIRGHNTIFGVWADAGILAFTLFLILILRYFHSALHTLPPLRYFAFSVILVLVIYMMSLQTIINQGYLLAVFVLLAYLIEDSKNKGEPWENTPEIQD